VAAVHDHRRRVDSAAASQVSCRILRDGMRMRLLAEATLIRYGACTYSGMLDAFSVAASSRGLGFFSSAGYRGRTAPRRRRLPGRGQGIVLVDVRTNKHVRQSNVCPAR